MVLGVGNLRPNEQDANEDEEPEEPKNEVWKAFLEEEDGKLKPWSVVTQLKGTKVNIGYAMREFLREAWGKLSFLSLFLPSNFNLFSLLRQKGEDYLGGTCQRSPIFD